MNVKEKVKDFIKKEKLIQKDDRVLLGLSGGADSVCLFYLLLELQEEIGFVLRAVHVLHGIREEAEEDVSYVEELCGKEGVLCCVFRENVPKYAKQQRLSEEEAGRILRYQDFRKCLKKWRAEEEKEKSGLFQYKIATAHHENDQAETVLFQLFRGCGISGLRGILPKRGDIIRPILCLSRKEIKGYLGEKGISWCEDKTNASEDYSRNKIRHQILPYAEKEISNRAVSHIGKTAEIVREAEEYIRKQTEAAYWKISVEQDGGLIFDIALLQREDIFLQKQLILYGLEKVSTARKDIGAVHVEDILKLIGKQGNGELVLPGRIGVRKVYRKLLIFQESVWKENTVAPEILSEDKHFLYGDREPLFQVEKINLSEQESVKKRFGIQNILEIIGCIPEKKYTKWFDYDKIETAFSFRHRESGDYLTINNEMNRKSLRRYMIEEKIPISQRDCIWLLADGPHVMWVPGGRMSAYYKVTEQTKTILQIKICMEE